MVFKGKNIIKNYGFYIISFILLLFFISIFLFCFKFYRLFLRRIDEVLFPSNGEKKISFFKSNKKKSNKETNDKEIDIDPISGKKVLRIKRKIENKNQKNNFGAINSKNNILNKKYILAEANMSGMSDNSSNRMELVNKNKINNELINDNSNNKDDISNYNDFEINSLTYDKALVLDKRSFYEYYASYLKYNNLLLFSFIPNGDYNPRLIKMFLYFFFFSLNIVFNALFFTDEAIQIIYEDKGSFNLEYQIPPILYSTIISVFIFYLMRYIFLTENNIEEMKEEIKKNKNLEDKVKKLSKKMKIKFILLFIIIFIILSFIWFYISCFCGVYKNTQTHLIRDALLSFFIAHVYTFITCLLPASLRRCSLKAKRHNKGYLYNISQMLENI